MLNKKIRKNLFEIARVYKTDIIYYHYNQIKEDRYYLNYNAEFQLIVIVSNENIRFSINDLRYDEVGVGLDDYPLVYDRATFFNETDVENVLHNIEYCTRYKNFKEFLERLAVILREKEYKTNE